MRLYSCVLKSFELLLGSSEKDNPKIIIFDFGWLDYYHTLVQLHFSFKLENLILTSTL